MENIFEYFYNSYKKYPHKPYIFYNKYWTYNEIYYYVEVMIARLVAKGIKIDNKVVLYLDNSIEYIISYFAILYVGATVVTISESSTLDTINDIIDDCKPTFLLTSNAMFLRIKNNEIVTKTIVMVVNINEFNDLDCFNLNMQFSTGELAMIIYTSGTTSKSKGVMLTHNNLIANTGSILDYLHINSNDSILVIIPFSYSYGNSLLLTHTKVGGLLYLSKERIFPQTVLSILQKENITVLSTVGSYLKILLKQNNLTSDSFKKLKYVTLAGEQTANSDLITLQNTNKNLKIYVMYGQTEASARLTYLEPNMLNKKLGSVGKPIKGVNLKIVDEYSNEVNHGEIGEIIVNGDNIMQGYLNKPQETNEVLRGRWLYTGDLAFKDPDGYVYIVGRKNDIIKYLGYRISPIEIENYINLCENILESAVIEHSDKDNNVTIIAYIVLANTTLGICDISKPLRSNLPLYKIPSTYIVVNDLPKTTNGKIKRAELRKLAANLNNKKLEIV